MAKSRSIGSIYAELTVRDKMSRQLRKARKSLNEYGRAGVKYAAITGAALAAGLTAGTKHALSLGAELDHLATQTGVSAGSLAILGQAYKDNGRDSKNLAKDIGKMQKAIFDVANGNTTIDYFAELGLSVQKLMGMDPADQFAAIGKAIRNVEDPTRKAALAMGIFGRSGAGLVTVFNGTDLDDVARSLGRMPALLDKFSGGFERADTLLGRLPNKADEFFVGFTSGVIGQILPALESTNNFDFTTLGENLGLHLAAGIEAIQSGDAWELFQLHADKALTSIQTSPAINGLAAAINVALDPVAWERFKLTGEKTLLEMQKSPALNGFAASINAIIDGLNTQGGESFDFGDAFDKYYNAGEAANQDLVDDLNRRLAELPTFGEKFAEAVNNGIEASSEKVDEIQRKIDEINAKAERNVETARAAAAAVGKSTAAPAASATETPAAPLGTPAQNLTNEYQRRGLSLDAGGRGRGIESAARTTEDILKLLQKNFSVRRELRI